MSEAARQLSQEVAPLPAPGRTFINGKEYLTNAKGAFVPVETVRTADLLQDETVRKILGYAVPLAAQIQRFKSHTFEDVSNFLALLDQEHGAKRGGQKGNITLITYDGLLKVQVQVADQIKFGPELLSAKVLVDECLRDWSDDAPPALRAIVEGAFDVEKEGYVSPSKLFAMLRYRIEDERWVRAMEAVRDSIRVEGSKEYVRFYRRAKPTDAWEAVSIDVATA